MTEGDCGLEEENWEDADFSLIHEELKYQEENLATNSSVSGIEAHYYEKRIETLQQIRQTRENYGQKVRDIEYLIHRFTERVEVLRGLKETYKDMKVAVATDAVKVIGPVIQEKVNDIRKKLESIAGRGLVSDKKPTPVRRGLLEASERPQIGTQPILKKGEMDEVLDSLVQSTFVHAEFSELFYFKEGSFRAEIDKKATSGPLLELKDVFYKIFDKATYQAFFRKHKAKEILRLEDIQREFVRDGIFLGTLTANIARLSYLKVTEGEDGAVYDLEKAEYLYKTCLEQGYREMPVLLGLSRLYIDKGKYDEALKLTDSALSKDKSNSAARYLRAEAMVRKVRMIKDKKAEDLLMLSDAESLLVGLLETFEKDPNIYYLLAVTNLEKGNLQSAQLYANKMCQYAVESFATKNDMRKYNELMLTLEFKKGYAE